MSEDPVSDGKNSLHFRKDSGTFFMKCKSGGKENVLEAGEKGKDGL